MGHKKDLIWSATFQINVQQFLEITIGEGDINLS